jgi:hypothetical protein
MEKYHTSQKSHKNKNKPFSHSIKSTMSHMRGLPPAPNWGNKFTAIIFEENLLYISNNYIINIDLIKKEFYQMINSNYIDEVKEKFILIANLSSEIFLAVTCKSKFIIFQKYYNTTNLEDKRVYFKEIKKFYFAEINLLDSRNEENSFRLQSLKVILKDNLILCGDNQGNLHMLKFINKTSTKSNTQIEEVELKYLYSIMIGSLKNYITDILIIKNLLIFSTSGGDIVKYSLYKDNLSKIQDSLKEGNVNMTVKQEKFIMSLDYLEIDENKFILVSIDKNGSLSIYLLENYSNEISTNINNKLLLFEKNKFNDKSIQENYVYFTAKFLYEGNSCVKLLVTSNLGKIYISDFSLSELLEGKIIPQYKEITDNPHEMVIFNILPYKNKLIFISADNQISFFKSPEILFEYDIKTLGSVIKSLHHNYLSNSIYLFSEKNSIIQYNYNKKFNGLMSVIRKRKDKKKHKEKSSVDILLTQQANFNHNVFALVTYNQSNKFTYIEIYYFSSDYKINKLKYQSIREDSKILNIVFYANSKIYKDDIKMEQNHFENKKDSLFNNTINEIFLENKNYDLLYILDDQGIVTVWDYIYNQTNRFKISNSVIESSLLYPLKNSYILNISKTINDEIKFSIFDQTFYTKIGGSNHEDMMLDCFYSETINEIFILQIFSNTNLTIFHSKDLSLLNSDLNNYEEYINFLKNRKEDYFRKIDMGCLTNLPVKNIDIFKNNTNEKSENFNFNFLISQSDNVLKIFEFTYNSNEDIYKLSLKYSINAHLNKILQVKWITEDFIASTSLDHSLKLWDIRMCRAIDLCIAEKKFTIKQESDSKIDELENIKLMNNITKINSMCLFQQSYKTSQDFVNLFETSYNDLINKKTTEEEIVTKFLNNVNQVGFYDWLIFSFYKDTELNHKIASKIVQVEIQNILDSHSINKFLPNLVNLLIYALLFMTDAKEINTHTLQVLKKKLQINSQNIPVCQESKVSQDLNVNKLILTYEKIEDIINNFSNLEYLTINYSNILSTNFIEILYNKNYSLAIQILINNNLHAEAITLFKLAKMSDFKILISILDKLRSYIYPKQNFQAMKIKRVTEILSSYILSNNSLNKEK